METNEKWFAIVNPASGFGKVATQWRAIKAHLEKENIPFDFELTTPENKGNKVVQSAILNGYRKIICVGGDGNFQDVANGILQQKDIPSTDVLVSMISLGTGNDWIKTSGVPKDYKKAISLLKNGKSLVQNVGLSKSYVDGKLFERYFCNFAGAGFDAYVVKQMSGIKGLGQISYLVQMVKCLFTFNKPNLRISFNNQTLETLSYLTLAGIGKYGGGGMKLTPGATLDGDSFFFTIAKDLSVLEVLANAPGLFNGAFINHPKVETHFTKHIKIEALENASEIFMQVDGEVLGSGPFEISLIPQALKVLIP
jgi:YegS/Rv2252/BmrU family lipid kinase